MSDLHTVLLILAIGAVTYATRFGGHYVLSRFHTLHPRVEAALSAVPAAVITTLVVPPALSKGPAEMIALVVAGLLALRFSGVLVLFAGLATLVSLRALGL